MAAKCGVFAKLRKKKKPTCGWKTALLAQVLPRDKKRSQKFWNEIRGMPFGCRKEKVPEKFRFTGFAAKISSLTHSAG